MRVPDLHGFRRTIAAIAAASSSEGSPEPLVVVPTHAAGRVLAEYLAALGQKAPTATRDQLYERLHRALASPPRRLTEFEREAIAQAACETAAAAAGDLPFRIRPGLVAEVLRFYDLLRRQSQPVHRFEELMRERLGGGVDDRGAERLLRQTEFLALAFREYERRTAGSGAYDEHSLRARILAEPAAAPIRHVVVTMPDWIADAAGLFVADFEMLAQVPDLASVDLVCTIGVLESGFHERIHNWWPGLDEIDGEQLTGPLPKTRPRLAVSAGEEAPLWTSHRDREEELTSVAARVTAGDAPVSRMAVVFKHPLPYLYLAPDTLGARSVGYRVYDGLPLAAEPLATAVDLALNAAEADFARDAIVALLRSPHFVAADAGVDVSASSIAALNVGLSKSRYLGGLDRLEALAIELAETDAGPACRAALTFARELSSLKSAAPASQQLERLSTFLARHVRTHEGESLYDARDRAARDAVDSLLLGLKEAHARYHDATWSLDDLAAAVRRALGERLCAPRQSMDGVHLLTDQAARYGDFDDMTIVGLVEHEWPERPRRNIFYTPALLKALGWPSERDRRAADDARFLDLVSSSTTRVELSTFALDDESLVSRSVQLDEVPRAMLTTFVEPPSADEPAPVLPHASPDWMALRSSRPSSGDPAFHGYVGARAGRTWSVSALETYLGCPFRFFAQHVLKLEEEPEDEEVMDPRRQGEFVHTVFEDFFSAWQDAGHGAITPGSLEQARAMFDGIVQRALERLPAGEAELERARLLGTSAATGLGEAVFRMEAERSQPVVERLLEQRLNGTFTIETSAGPRRVTLRGKADRIDLLADGTFRLIDYKLGWPPDRSRALQLPIYSLCAEQLLAGRRGRTWTTGEAIYLAFKGPKRVVPLFTSAEQRADLVARAQQRLADTLDAIERGEFPPSPDDVFRCETCSFAAVCRKDYVGPL